MDGTLVDSDAAVERSWFAWGAEYGVDPEYAVAVAHGASSRDSIRKLIPDLDADALAVAAQRQMDLQYTDLADVVATPGAHELLATLDRLRLPWAVVTSADVRLAKARLDAAGIPQPLVLVTIEDLRIGKPDPEGYLLAASRLGVPPAVCLVVEDAQAGIDAGRAAGMRVAALRGLDADLRIRDLRELAGILD
jgi:HAD superfamily hydrolase (TIGR01509 family)